MEEHIIKIKSTLCNKNNKVAQFQYLHLNMHFSEHALDPLYKVKVHFYVHFVSNSNAMNLSWGEVSSVSVRC